MRRQPQLDPPLTGCPIRRSRTCGEESRDSPGPQPERNPDMRLINPETSSEIDIEDDGDEAKEN